MSGCVWDVILNLGGPTSDAAIDRTSFLWVNSICLHSGDQITPEITIDFLTIDDNDDNIYNGTPNYFEINDAFSSAQHGRPRTRPDRHRHARRHPPVPSARAVAPSR